MKKMEEKIQNFIRERSKLFSKNSEINRTDLKFYE